MSEYIIHSIFYKALSNANESSAEQYNILTKIINEIQLTHPLLNPWYINIEDIDLDDIENFKPPLEYLVPSDSARKYLLKSRNEEPFQAFLLWNGRIDNSECVSISFSPTGLSFSFDEKFDTKIIIKLFEEILKNLKCKYLFLSNSYFMDNRVFEHRQPVSSICYVPKMINEKDIPHLYSKFDVSNNLNQGSILIFDQNLFDESEQMKRKIQENAIALVDLDLIPETELDSDFFNEVEI